MRVQQYKVKCEEDYTGKKNNRADKAHEDKNFFFDLDLVQIAHALQKKTEYFNVLAAVADRKLLIY